VIQLSDIMKPIKSLHLLVIITSLSFGFFMSDAYAYIDPGSGSMIIQMIIGALVGVGITLKIYWYKIKEKLSFKASKE